jgi:hypothetical protein
MNHNLGNKEKLTIFSVLAGVSLMTISVILIAYTAKPGNVSTTLMPRSYLPLAVNPLTISIPQIPSGVSILPNHSSYVDSSERLHVLFEISNTSAIEGSAGVEARLFDTGGNGVDRSSTIFVPDGYTDLFFQRFNSMMSANEQHCFDIVFNAQPPRWTSYQISLTSFITSSTGYQQYAPAMVMLDDISATKKSNGNYQVFGRLTNTDTDDSHQDFIKVYATLYDSAGKVIGCAPAILNNDPLSSSESSYFKAIFTGRTFNDVAHYRIYAVKEVSVIPVSTGPLVGTAGQLRVTQNPIPLNGTITAYWNVSNIAAIFFDSGDGTGFKPAAGAQVVSIGNVSGQRLLQLQWRDNSGNTTTDQLTVYINGQVVPLGTTAAPPVSQTCNSSDPNWRGANSNYPFCVAQDLDWSNGASPVRYFSQGQDVWITMHWSVYGISGLWLEFDPNGSQCGPAANGSREVAVNGTGTYTFHVSDFPYGGYLIHLKVLRNDGVTVYYNEKYMCIGTYTVAPTTNPNPPTRTVTPVPTPAPVASPTAKPTPQP